MPPSALWSQTQEVSHLYPVYNTDGVATSGIKEWKTTTADATIVADASEAVTWNAGWYVVTGNITLSKGAVCQGDVHLILADGATLTAKGFYEFPTRVPGIQVSGNDNSLTIYAQSTGDQMGQLIASGGGNAAGYQRAKDELPTDAEDAA